MAAIRFFRFRTGKRRFGDVDRTPYIEKLERFNDRMVVFRRPLGFDRKRFISMLSCYYGIQYAASFKSLFKRYYIGRHKTANANRYHILVFDLRHLDLSSLQQVERTLTDAVWKGIEAFYRDYPDIHSSSVSLNDRFDEILTAFLYSCPACNIYLFLDDEQGLISSILSSEAGTSPFNPIARSLIFRLHSIIQRAMSDGIIHRVLSLGIDESDDR